MRRFCHAASAGETNSLMKFTWMTPPFCGSSRRTSSGTLRGWDAIAAAFEWEKNHGRPG